MSFYSVDNPSLIIPLSKDMRISLYQFIMSSHIPIMMIMLHPLRET